MVVGFPVTENRGKDSILDPRFGRCSGFLVIDTEAGQSSYVTNTQDFEAAHGAGIQAARLLLDAGVGQVVSGLCGPNAYKVLSSAGVELFYKKGGTVAEGLEELKAGTLKRAEDANVEGHWV